MVMLPVPRKRVGSTLTKAYFAHLGVIIYGVHSIPMSRRYKMHGISHLAPDDVQAAPPPTHGIRHTSIRTHPLARWQQGDTPISTNSWQTNTTPTLLSRHDSIESLMDPPVCYII